jgi:predicted CopG family antitoxin
MTTLQISDHIASILSNMAQQEHLSSSELIERLVDKYRKEHELLEDLMDSLPNLPTFKGAPMDIQRAMRDEWS